MSVPVAAIPFRLPLIAILRGIEPKAATAHVATLIEEGFDAIEIPTTSPQWMRSVAAAVRAYGGDAMIGAGTLLERAQVDALVEVGGRLAVTPDTCPELIRHALARKLTLVAGFATATEAFSALRAGAPMLKLFPASVHGPPLVRALRSVLPPVPLFAVGGVTPDSLAGFLCAGCQGAGIGGELYAPGQNVAATRARARRFRQAFLDHAA